MRKRIRPKMGRIINFTRRDVTTWPKEHRRTLEQVFPISNKRLKLIRDTRAPTSDFRRHTAYLASSAKCPPPKRFLKRGRQSKRRSKLMIRLAKLMPRAVWDDFGLTGIGMPPKKSVSGPWKLILTALIPMDITRSYYPIPGDMRKLLPRRNVPANLTLSIWESARSKDSICCTPDALTKH